MAVTNVRGRQLRDDDVYRQDLNTTVSGSAVIRRVIAGTGISLSSTGVDTGTGDVTISQVARTINGVTYDGSSNITITANTTNALTFNNGGAGIAPNNSFNGSAAVTVSYNTIGAPGVNGQNAQGNWNINSATATVLQTARTINGVSFNGSADIAVGTLYDTNYKRIVSPGGAEYNPGGTPVTGAFAITLPVGFINSMIELVVRVYNYNTNTSFDVYCGGYVYSVGPTWVNVFAYITGPQTTDLRYNVRFGTNGTNPVIYIGETNSTWSYPQVYVTEVQVGHGNQSVTWTTGWGITAVTTFGTVHTTVSSAQLGYATSTNTVGAVVLRDGSGNFSAGTITATGQLISTRANSTPDGTGQIYLNGTVGNRIDFNTAGVAAPALTTRSVGTKIVLYPTVSATLVDYALGITNSTLWYSVPSSAEFFRWYGGTTNTATLTGAGALSLSSSITATNLSMSGAVDNYIAGNLGLGVVTPTTKFDVSGTGRFVNTTASNNGGALFTGTIPTAWPFPLETSATSRYTIIGQGTSGAISFPSINNYGTVGVIGTTIGSTGGRTNMGVFGYTYFAQNMSGNSGNRGYGGYFLAKGIGSVTDFIGTYAGIYAEASMGSDTGTAGDIVAADLVSVGKAQQIAYGARINVSGGGTNYGVYVTADRNYFSGNVGIKTTNPLTSLHAYTSTADSTAAGRTTPLNVLTLEVENTSAAIEYAGFGGAIVFRGSTYNNTTQRTLGRIVHQINDSSVGTQGTSLAFELSPDATNTTLVTRMLLNFNGQLRLPSYTSSTSFTGTSAGLLGIDSSGNVITESITLSGAVTGTGTESITTTLSNGVVGIANLSATGTASASTYLRGDNTWATIPSANSTTRYDQSFTATAGQTQITVNNALAEAAFDVYINGVKANVDSFTWSGSTITFVDALAAGDIVDVVNYVTVSQVGTAYGSAWSMTSGAGTGTAVFDTVERSGVALYDVVITANPNSDGSTSYRDYYYGKLAVTTGYNGAAVVHYIHFIQESPMPRTMHGSGGGNLSVDAVFFSGSSESTTFTVGSNYVVRFKISGYITTGTGSNTTVFLKQIG